MDKITQQIIDEISLEGLDGITIPTLWLRLEQPACEFKQKITENLKNYILRYIISNEFLSLYKLEKPRKEPQIFNRFPDHPCIGNHMAKAPDEKGELEDVYKILMVNDTENDVRGSCVEYQTRKEVTDEIRDMQNVTELNLFSTFGAQQLVIVASQRLRTKALLQGTENVPPKAVYDLTVLQYCILERLGRARCQGELQSLLDQVVFNDHKTYHIHYIMRVLTFYKLVNRRYYCYSLDDKTIKAVPQILLHHPRFKDSPYAWYESMQQKAYDLLSKAPGKTLVFNELGDKLGLEVNDLRKLYKFLSKLCKKNVIIKQTEESVKPKSREFITKAITYLGGKQDIETDLDDDAVDNSNCDSHLVVEHSFVLQAWHYILENAHVGVSNKDLMKCFPGYGKLETRSLNRVLEKMKLTKSVLEDHGRQRTQKFIPSNLHAASDLSKDFIEAKKKMKYLLLTSCFSGNDNKEASPSKANDDDPSKAGAELSFIEHIKNFQSEGSSNSKMDGDFTPSFCNSTLLEDLSAIDDTSDTLTHQNMILSILNNRKIVEGVDILCILMNSELLSSSATTKEAVEILVESMHKDELIHLVKVLIKNQSESDDEVWIIASTDVSAETLEKTICSLKLKTSLDLTPVTNGEKDKSTDLSTMEEYVSKAIITQDQSLTLTDSINTSINNISAVIEDAKVNIVDDGKVKKWDSNMTTKNLSRRNIVLSYVNEVKVVEGAPTIYKVIVEKEKLMGNDRMVDRKTVRRLLERMHKEGLIRLVKVSIKIDELVVLFWFIVSLNASEKVLEDAINHTKFRVSTDIDNKSIKMNKANEHIIMREKSATFESIAKNTKHTKCLPKPYGVLPKFLKLKLLHRFIYFMTHWNEKEYQEEQDSGIIVNYKEDERNWRQHIPRRPANHDPCMVGKIMYGDVIGVMPLHMILHLFRVDQFCDEFIEYLKDDEKKYYRLCQLPEHLQAVLVYKRRHVMHSFKLVELLAFMGILSIGDPGTTRPAVCRKEYERIRLHTFVQLTDTRKSGKSYKEVTFDNYEKFPYTLNSMEKLEAYWNDMQKICLTTGLGFRSSDCKPVAHAHYDIVLREWIQHVHYHRLKDDADTGYVPGDALGAGGFDSGLFAHRYNNWSNDHFAENRWKAGMRSVISGETNDEDMLETPPKKPKIVKKKWINSNGKKIKQKPEPDLCKNDIGFTKAKVSNVGRNERVKGGKGLKRKLPEIEGKDKKQAVENKKRRIPENMKVASKLIGVRYIRDDKDIDAINKRNGRERVKFSRAEDAMLVIYSVTSAILKSKYRIKGQHMDNILMPGDVIRDLLLEKLPNLAYDKTCASILRRARVMLKATKYNLFYDMCLLEAMKDPIVRKELESTEIKSMDDLSTLFIKLVHILTKKFDDQPGLYKTEISDSVHEMNDKFKVIVLHNDKQVSRRNVTPRFKRLLNDKNDLLKYTLENLVYSALIAKRHPYTCTPLQLKSIFAKYNSDDTKVAFRQVKSHNLVTTKARFHLDEILIPHALPTYRVNNKFDMLFSSVIPETDLHSLEKISAMPLDFKVPVDAGIEHIFSICNIMFDKKGNINLKIPDMITPDIISHVADVSLQNDEQSDAESSFKVPSRANEPNFIEERTKYLESIKLCPCDVIVKQHTKTNNVKNAKENFVNSLFPVLYEPIDLDTEFKKYCSEFPAHEKIVTEINNILDKQGPCGVNFSELHDKLSTDCDDGMFQIILESLCSRNIIYIMGIIDKRVVLCSHAETWFVTGLVYNGTLPKMSEMNHDARKEKADMPHLNQENYTPVHFNCKPWHKIDGSVNEKALKIFTSSLYTYILQNPGILVSKLEYYYRPVLQQSSVNQLIDALCQARLISMHEVKEKTKFHVLGRRCKMQKTLSYCVPLQGSEYRFSDIILNLGNV